MKIKSYILILIGLSISFAAGSQDLQTGFVEELRQSTADVESISCRLTQTRAMSVLVKEDVKAGKFYYLRPGNILLSFDDSIIPWRGAQGKRITVESAEFRSTKRGFFTQLLVVWGESRKMRFCSSPFWRKSSSRGKFRLILHGDCAIIVNG